MTNVEISSGDRWSEDARAEINRSVEYFGNGVLLLSRYPYEQRALRSINTPISSSTPVGNSIWVYVISSLSLLLLRFDLR